MEEELDEGELRCLAEAIYFEARNEDVYGQTAVAEVVLNRRDHERFPSTICQVVRQGYSPDRLHRCQFSYYCDGKPEAVGEKERYARISALAWHVLRSHPQPQPLTLGATHYHATYVAPKWAKAMDHTRTVGRHHFYRALSE